MRRREEFVVGYFYHIYNRGVEKRGIFLENRDYERFLEYLYLFNDIKSKEYKEYKLGGRGSESRERLVDVLCFQLMPNHFHLILSPCKEDGMIKFMRKIMTGYAMYFNKKYKRTGVLFESRYKSKLIETNAYFSHLTRYIHINCLELIFPDWNEKGIKDWDRAIEFLKNYKWSSFLFYIEKKNLYNILSEELILKHLQIEIGEKYIEFLLQWIPSQQE
ncbi:MAG: transposase [Candidatus Omnitrophica bacterium]|nr:transposase [Candidatus Omnitrophota bacterium]